MKLRNNQMKRIMEQSIGEGHQHEALWTSHFIVFMCGFIVEALLIKLLPTGDQFNLLALLFSWRSDQTEG